MLGILRSRTRWRMICSEAEERADALVIESLEKLPFGDVVVQLERFQIKPREAVFAWFLQRCTDDRSLELGKRVHAHIVRSGFRGSRFISNHLVDMFGKCGEVESAKFHFDGIRRRNVYSWTVLITAYAQNGYYRDALKCLWHLDFEGIRPTHVTFVELLVAFSALQLLQKGKLLHQRLSFCGLTSNLAVSNSLINMYAKCKSPGDARAVFDALSYKDTISWTTLCAAYAQSGHYSEALEVFKQMTLEGVSLNRVTYVTATDVCANLNSLSMGRSVHEVICPDILASETCVANSLITMYSKCNSLEEAKQVFDRMEKRDLVAWNSIIGAYAKHGKPDEALDLYYSLRTSTELQPDVITVVTALEACCSPAYITHARAVHADVIQSKLDAELMVTSALIHAYGKCSSIALAREVFDAMQAPSLVCWNALLMVYAQNGHQEEVVELFMRMALHGLQADEYTFLSLIFAFNHGGCVEDCVAHYSSMVSDYGLAATREQCGCLLDLLGRSGWLVEAEEFMYNMEFQPDQIIWSTFVGACVTHQDIDRGIRAAERVVDCVVARLPCTWEQSGPYVAISNLLALASRKTSSGSTLAGLSRLNARLKDAGYVFR